MLIEDVVPKPPMPPLLILVHPGSCCGSTNNQLGKSAGNAYREGVVMDVNAWQGGILVLDGELSDELKHYPDLWNAIRSCLARAKANGYPAKRFWACDNNVAGWPGKSLEVVRQLGYTATDKIVLTGAWVGTEAGFGEDSGCVTAMYNLLKQSQFMKVDISDNAIPDSDEYAGYFYDDEDDEEDY